MKMKKLFVGMSALVLGLSLASCKKNKEVKVNVGMGYNVELATKQTYSEPKVTYEQADIVAAFVAFNTESGKIEACRLDCVQTKVVGTSAEVTEGEGDQATTTTLYGVKNLDGVATRADYKTKTKLELGSAYAMKGSSAIGQEVNYQIEAFAKWTVGKTVDEVFAGVDSSTKKTTDEELLASCSISVLAYAEAIKIAYANKSAEAFAFDGAKAGVSISAGPAYNYGKPSVEVSADLCGCLVKDGKIVAAACDAVVLSYETTEELVVSPKASKYLDTTKTKYAKSCGSEFISKKILGEDYAMRSASPIQAEWFEQIAAFESFCVGKTAEEVGSATKADIEGLTITETSYTGGMKLAAQYALLDVINPN